MLNIIKTRLGLSPYQKFKKTENAVRAADIAVSMQTAETWRVIEYVQRSLVPWTREEAERIAENMLSKMFITPRVDDLFLMRAYLIRGLTAEGKEETLAYMLGYLMELAVFFRRDIIQTRNTCDQERNWCDTQRVFDEFYKTVPLIRQCYRSIWTGRLDDWITTLVTTIEFTPRRRPDSDFAKSERILRQAGWA